MEREHATKFLHELHRAQASLYAGGAVEAVRVLLRPEVVWHVPGQSLIAGDYEGVDEVIAYMLRRRDLADRTFRMRCRDLLIGQGVYFAALTDGSALIAGRAWEWSTIGIYRLDREQLAECWLVPFDQAQFDAIWSGARD
jgi:uncharacterized protein